MRCASVLAFAFLALGLSWAQVELSPSTISPQEEPGINWNELDLLLLNLSAEAESLRANSQSLSDSLQVALNGSKQLSSKLAKSQVLVSELRSSLLLSELSLSRLKRTMDIELWVWRGVSAIGLASTLAVLIFH
jgi:hypothetical protein